MQPTTRNFLLTLAAATAAAGCAGDKPPAPTAPSFTIGTPINTGSRETYTLAVIGDTPYGPVKLAELPSLVALINRDPKVDLVAHLFDDLLEPLLVEVEQHVALEEIHVHFALDEAHHGRGLERRVQRVRRAVSPPGEARDDLSIIKDLSKALGYPMDYRSPEQVLEEFGRLWPAMGGITYDRIKSRGIAWPCPTKDHPGTEFLYRDGFAKKIPFMPIAFNPPAEVASRDYPFILTTGRNLYQYHSGTMTRQVRAIEKHAGEAYVELNPLDGAKLGIAQGDLVTVRSRRGELKITARFTRRVSEGTVFIPMHYREAAANVLTNDALDPDVKIPEFKVCAVNVVLTEKQASKEVLSGRK